MQPLAILHLAELQAQTGATTYGPTAPIIAALREATANAVDVARVADRVEAQLSASANATVWSGRRAFMKTLSRLNAHTAIATRLRRGLAIDLGRTATECALVAAVQVRTSSTGQHPADVALALAAHQPVVPRAAVVVPDDAWFARVHDAGIVQRRPLHMRTPGVLQLVQYPAADRAYSLLREDVRADPPLLGMSSDELERLRREASALHTTLAGAVQQLDLAIARGDAQQALHCGRARRRRPPPYSVPR